MTLSERLSELVRAAFSGIWILSYEQAEALAEIAQLCRQQDPPWSLAAWDIERGLSIEGQAAPDSAGQDPLARKPLPDNHPVKAESRKTFR